MTIMFEAGFTRVSLCDAHAPASGFSPLHIRRLATSDAVTDAEPDRFACGYEQGQAEAHSRFADERAGLLQLLATAQAFQPEPSEELAALIAMTVERLVTELVGRAPVDGAWLTARIADAVACVAAADAARTLWLHPDDIALLGDKLPPLDTRADDTLPRGALRFDCSQGWIEDNRSHGLESLRAALAVEMTS